MILSRFVGFVGGYFDDHQLVGVGYGQCAPGRPRVPIIMRTLR
ncbi:MAG TPA: hypothetical protein VJN19_04960 [Propionibacteriaceae bacterium]|nr:hypothetical protein [Propionibacteriaceae bacterium]